MTEIRPTSKQGQTAHVAEADRGGTILLAHGGGGQLTDELLSGSVLPRLGNGLLNELLDSAILPETGGDRLALTIDGYVVQPWRFPGGDIGRLAVCGTVNDLAVCGAKPVAIALGLILAEGFPRANLETVLDSIAATARDANVKIVTGDTKVVGADKGDGIYITTAGIGLVPPGRRLHPDQVQPGDVLIINGPIADHGLAVMLAREMPEMQSALCSDVAPLNGLIERVHEQGEGVAFMRDPTRGGLAGLAADLAARCGRRIVLEETAIGVRPETRHAAEMLGLDPLEVANEGKVVLAVRSDKRDVILRTLRDHPLGREARVIGRVEEERIGRCELQTAVGGRRIVQKPYGEQLPRIC